MVVLETDKLDGPDQGSCPSEDSFSNAPGCPSATQHGSCRHCAEVMEQLNHRPVSYQPLPLGQVLLVFFLPLICAASLVITAVRSLPKLAEHPGYLALSALGVACSAILLARIFTRRVKTPKRG